MSSPTFSISLFPLAKKLWEEPRITQLDSEAASAKRGNISENYCAGHMTAFQTGHCAGNAYSGHVTSNVGMCSAAAGLSSHACS
jgi:hypothetical protein